MEQFFQSDEFLFWLDVSATIVGLVYIWQEYNAKIGLWITGIIMPVIDTFLYLRAGLYADFAMAVYYTLAGVYGYVAWRFGLHFLSTKKNCANGCEVLAISHFPVRRILPSIVVFLLSWGLLYWILVRFTNSNVPLVDSFANALSFIGLWALSRKYIEQWLIWIVVDAVLSGLYLYKGIPFKASLYALYVVIAVMGYRKWLKMRC